MSESFKGFEGTGALDLKPFLTAYYDIKRILRGIIT